MSESLAARPDSRIRSLADEPFASHTGRGVVVAVVDSGVHAEHPHVRGAIAGGEALAPEGDSPDFADRLGHGTAVAAAIVEKAPEASLLAIKVFDRRLATSADTLARAIVVAAERGARLINLSLGTPNTVNARVLGEAVAHATSRGAFIVSAYAVERVPWLPGALPDVVGVVVDWTMARDAIAVRDDDAHATVFAASGYPRPIPGVPPERNLSGISFAVANVTGFLARLLEREPEIRHASELAERLR